MSPEIARKVVELFQGLAGRSAMRCRDDLYGPAGVAQCGGS
jgi:hypothetical protein